MTEASPKAPTTQQVGKKDKNLKEIKRSFFKKKKKEKKIRVSNEMRLDAAGLTGDLGKERAAAGERRKDQSVDCFIGLNAAYECLMIYKL